MIKQAIALCVAVSGALSGCRGAERPVEPIFRDRELYLCCNLRFNRDHDASDANYAYPEGGTTIPAGTRVRVVATGEKNIEIQAERDPTVYNLVFRYGEGTTRAILYFRNILRDTDPRTEMAGASAAMAQAIEQGQLIKGMTKDQALMARGYPPFHRTKGIEADEWLYYYSRGFVDRVRFVDGKIESIERGPAPQWDEPTSR